MWPYLKSAVSVLYSYSRYIYSSSCSNFLTCSVVDYGRRIRIVRGKDYAVMRMHRSVARGGFYFPKITSQHPQVLCLVEGSRHPPICVHSVFSDTEVCFHFQNQMTGCSVLCRENCIKMSNSLNGDGKIALFLRCLCVVVIYDVKMAVYPA
jgi:hypothetical protein